MEDRIEINPDIRFGKPVIRGTRVPVTRVLAELADGVLPDQIAQQFGVTVEDIRAAITFANQLVRENSFIASKVA